MADMGIGFAIGNGYLVNYFARLFPLRDNFIYSNVVSAIIILMMLLFHHSIFNWIMIAPLACSVSISYASLLTLFSNQVDANSQGWVMGITGSVMAFVWAINGIIVGVLAAWHVSLPIFIAAASLFLSGIFMFVFYKPVRV